MEIQNNRVGNFTSSEIWKLTTTGKIKGTFGVPYYSYISDKNHERRACRSLQSNAFSYPTSWGNIIEKYLFNELELEYTLCSSDVLIHKDIPFWKGTPDITTENLVGDIKCPFTLTSFCDLVDMMESGIEAFKKDYREYYWQLVSNSILTGRDEAELIIFCPLKSELQKIRDFVDGYDSFDPFQYKWIIDSDDRKLPYLIDGKGYERINKFRFVVPKEDKDLLTSRVILAGKDLWQNKKK